MSIQSPISSAPSTKAQLETELRRDRRAVLIVNTHARNGDAKFDKARRLLEARGITLEASYAVRDPDRLPEIVENAIHRGIRFIIVGGGDGTISSVIDKFAYRDVVFGLLPLGTANSFARTLSIPVDLESAVDVLVTGKVVDVDLGKIDDDYFANGSALGLSAAIAQAKPRIMKRWLGPAAYALVAVKALLRHRPFSCTLTLDGDVKILDALEVRIANGTHHGGIKVAEEASVESHDLVLYVIKGTSRWKLAQVWGNILLGRRLGSGDIEVIRTPHVRIETDPPQAVSVDGEVTTHTPVEASVARQSLHLIVPRDRDDLH
jgi:YegS/Rv2252/BmrU family lipid kinase